MRLFPYLAGPLSTMNILITGASKGIGKAIAEKFGSEGHALFLSARDPVRLGQAGAELRHRFPNIRVESHAADLARKEAVQALAAWALQGAGGAPDVLVNNAGIYLPGSLATEADGNLEELMAVNLYGAYHLTRALLPALTTRGQGHIFNMCSVASVQASDKGGAYSISKYALLGFSRNLREEMKPHGIKVTAVIPGAVYTSSWAGSGVEPERLIAPEDIADLVYAASQLSSRTVVEDILIRPRLGDL